MAFQSQNLVMVGLGVRGDSPPNTIQPPLPDGIHLRWSFRRDLGIPWYGYYLFRRRHQEEKMTCITHRLRELQLSPGPLSTFTLNLLNGRFVSDQNIVLTSLFPPPHFVEFDLRDRGYLRFYLPPSEPASQVQVTLGFLRERGDGERVCVDFAGLNPPFENPLSFKDITFLVLDHDGDRWSGQQIGAMGGRIGLNVGFETRIKLPCPASRVSLSLGHTSSPLRIVARNERGDVVDTAGMNGNIDTVTLTGDGIVELQVIAPQNEAFLFELCYVCAVESEEEEEKRVIQVQALSGDLPVVTKEVGGQPGHVVTETFSFDIITAMEFSSGPAVVIDICWAPIDRSVLRGWEIVPEFPAPLCLPVAHPDYPCVNRPGTEAAAEDMAVNRVRYGDPDDWRGDPFNEMHDQLELLVDGGPPPTGEPMAQRKVAITGVPDNPSGSQDPVMPEQYPLDLVLMASLNPAIAQMLGLYWVDQTADPGQAYDYLILADHSNEFGGSASKALNWLVSSPDFVGVDGYIVFNKRVAPAPPLVQPGNPRAYALPGATFRADDGSLIDASNNAGVRWDLGVFLGFLLPGRAVLYHLWRVDLGNSEPTSPTPPLASDYNLLTEEQPILAVEPDLPSGVTVTYPPDWPPFSLQAIDTALPEGWYSYRINGIDIFGRHSAHSGAARWFQWTLAAGQPQPWYYQDPPGGEAQVHPYAVGLLDKIAPPPPTAIEAYALDPRDPYLVRDTAYSAWQASLTAGERESLVGLRLRWQWTFSHMQQAPDAKEFRVYYQPGRINALLGRITAVTPSGSSQSSVETDIPNTQPANAYADTRLRVGGDSFRVVGSQAGTPLRLTVANIGPGDDIPPPAPAACSVVIPEQDGSGDPHPLYVDYDQPANWETRYHVVDYNQNVTVTSDGDGNPLRVYEIFLPASGGSGLPLVSSLAEPIVYAQIGVSTTDDKTHTDDHPTWSGTTWGDRPGNEGRAGGKVTIFRVWRERPPAPVPPPDSEKVFATPADYHARSFYTYRWQPSPHLKAHVFRAMDEAVFKADWTERSGGSPTIAAADEHLFPVELRGADPGLTARRGEIATELNHINTFSHDSTGTQQALAYYRGMSNDGLRVLASLPWTEPAFTQITLHPLDPDDPALVNRPGPDNPADFPIDPTLRIYIDTLDGRATNRYFYRSTYIDGAQNRSESLSLSSPPVYLPNVVPPRMPVVTRVEGGDRQITLRWASNREPDLTEYRVYRTADEQKARDLRLMEEVHVLAVLPGDPAARPASNEWTDSVLGGVTFYYRLAAFDDAGNQSDPSRVFAGRAYDYGPPADPAWVRAEWVRLDAAGNEHAFTDATPGLVPAVALTLRTPQSDINLIVQRQENGTWKSATTWTKASAQDPTTQEWLYTAYDKNADLAAAQTYRPRLMSSAGVELVSENTRNVPVP